MGLRHHRSRQLCPYSKSTLRGDEMEGSKSGGCDYLDGRSRDQIAYLVASRVALQHIAIRVMLYNGLAHS